MSEVRWRLHLGSRPETVWSLLDTDAGRARFWAESAVERDGGIEFSFPNGMTWRGRIVEREPPRRFAVDYFGTPARFVLDGDGADGTDLTLTHDVDDASHAEVNAGWVSVLLTLKAAVDFGADLRNHDAQRTWWQGYCDN